MRRLRKGFRIAGIGLLAAAAAAALPILWVETSCSGPAAPSAAEAPAVPDAGYRRLEARSYLSYPEWYIVHAYEDFAGVLRQADEARFGYLASIRGFWSSLCGANRIAARSGGGDLQMKTMLYTIGLSFTAEMAVKGLYETTLGRLFAWLRGPERTEEDRFALRVAEDYARFLQQTPWYEYPFAAEVARLWRETSFEGPDLARKAERRLALSAEWGVKAGYAALLRKAAGLAPADLTIRSVVLGLDATDLAVDPRIAVVADLGGGRTLIETPRYRAFSEVLRGLAGRGRTVVEIAGNDRILVTALVPPGKNVDMPAADTIFALPIQSRPGWRRVGLDAEVPRLAALIGALERQGAVFEHAYDY